MTALRPIGTIVAVNCDPTDTGNGGINLATDSRVLNEFNLYNATKARVTNLTDQPIAVMVCEAQGNNATTGNADFIGVEAGFGLGAMVLPVGETVIVSKKAGSRLVDPGVDNYVVNPPENHWGEVIRLDDVSLLNNTGATTPTTGFVYASAVSEKY